MDEINGNKRASTKPYNNVYLVLVPTAHHTYKGKNKSSSRFLPRYISIKQGIKKLPFLPLLPNIVRKHNFSLSSNISRTYSFQKIETFCFLRF